jgi:hypothetical protein
MPAFMIILKRPRVKILMGKDKILTTGFTRRLKSPRSNPVKKAIFNLSHVVFPVKYMNGKKYEATAIEKVSITQSRIHLNK